MLDALDRSLYLLVTPAVAMEVLSEDSEQLFVDASESSGAVLYCCVVLFLGARTITLGRLSSTSD